MLVIERELAAFRNVEVIAIDGEDRRTPTRLSMA